MHPITQTDGLAASLDQALISRILNTLTFVVEHGWVFFFVLVFFVVFRWHIFSGIHAFQVWWEQPSIAEKRKFAQRELERQSALDLRRKQALRERALELERRSAEKATEKARKLSEQRVRAHEQMVGHGTGYVLD